MGLGKLVLILLQIFQYSRIPLATRAKTCVFAIPTALVVSSDAVGLSALSPVSVPTLSAFRRLALLVVMAAKYSFLSRLILHSSFKPSSSKPPVHSIPS